MIEDGPLVSLLRTLSPIPDEFAAVDELQLDDVDFDSCFLTDPAVGDGLELPEIVGNGRREGLV